FHMGHAGGFIKKAQPVASSRDCLGRASELPSDHRHHDRSGRRGVQIRSPSSASCLPSDHHVRARKTGGEKKRREAGEVASRRTGANTGKLFATGLIKAKPMPPHEMQLKQ